METNSKSGLTKIILINSFIKKGLMHEFDIERNVHITGTNGAGKTTFLRLLPVFYGMNAGEIVQKSDSTVSFAQWYLPNPASYIVFEYITIHLKRVQAVFFASTDGNKTRCRFINKAFEEEDYLFEEDGSKGAYTSSEIAKHWQANSIEFTPMLTRNNHYTKIIQGIQHKEISSDLYRYSIASSRTPLVRIDKIIHGILNSEMKIESMKSLLMQVVGQMHQFDTNIDVVVDNEGVDRWVREQRVVSRLNGHKDEFHKAIENHDAITLDESALMALLANLQFMEPLLNESLLSKTTQIKEKISAKQLLRSDYDEVEAGFKEDIRENRHNSELIGDDIKRIEGTYNKFEEDGIDQKIAEFNTLPEKQETLSKLKEQYDILLGESENVELQFDRLIADLKTGKLKLINDASKDLTELNELKNSLINKEKERYALQKNTDEDKYRTQEKILEDERSTHKIQIAVTKSKLEKVNAPVELLDKETLAKKEVTDNLRAQSAQNQVVNNAEKIAGKAKLDLDKLLTVINSNEYHKTELSQRRVTLHKQLDPKSGTLLSFLEDKLPEWQATPIGCLINPGILSRTDLTPEYNGKGSDNTFFGLNVDQSKLEASEESTEALRAQLSDITSQEIALTEKIESDKKSAELLTKERVQADEKFASQRRELKQIENKQVTLEQQAVSASMEVENAVTNLTEKLKKALVVHNKAFSATEKALKELAQKHTDYLEDIFNVNLENLMDIETAQDSIISSIETKIENIKAAEKGEIKELKNNKKEALTSKGISPEKLEDMDLQIAKSKTKIKTLEGYAATIRHHEEFMKGIYLNLPKLRSEKSELVAAITTLKAGSATATRKYSQENNRLNDLIKDLQEQLELLTRQQEKLTSIFKAQEDSLAVVNVAASQSKKSIADLFIEYDHITSQLESKIKIRAKSIKEIEHLLNKDGANNIYEFWHKSLRSKGFDVTDGDKMALFKDLALDILPQTERTLIAHIHTICSPIVTFTGKLEDFRSEIKSSSKKISQAVKENLVEFDAIERIDIQMVSKIDRVQGWEDLKRLCKRYQEWELNDDDRFPNDKFIKALQAVADHIDRGRIKKDFVDLFDLSFEVTENGNHKVAQTEKSFKALSSNGLLTLLTCILYSTLITMQRKGQEAQIHYPIDELGHLATDNAVKLLEMLNTNNITMIAALPEAKGEILKNFDNLYHIDEAHGKVDGYIGPNLLDQAIMEAEKQHNNDLTEGGAHV